MPDFLAEVLTWPGNSRFITALKTARSWGVPPSTIFLGTPSGWSETDRMLAMSLTILEEETCNSCGTPMWLGHSTVERSLGFQVDTTTCFGCAELESARTKSSKDGSKSKELKPGERHYVKHFMYGDVPTPSRYTLYEQEAIRAQKIRERQGSS